MSQTTRRTFAALAAAGALIALAFVVGFMPQHMTGQASPVKPSLQFVDDAACAGCQSQVRAWYPTGKVEQDTVWDDNSTTVETWYPDGTYDKTTATPDGRHTIMNAVWR